MKRAQRGQLPLVEAVKKLQSELMGGPAAGQPDAVANAKKIVLLLLGAAYQRFLGALEEQQEVMAGIADCMMNAYAMESAALRTSKLGPKGGGASDMAAVFTQSAMEQIELHARTVLAACAEGDTLRTTLALLKRLTKHEPVNVIEARRRIASRLLEAERYVV